MRYQCTHCFGVVNVEDNFAGNPAACCHCGQIAVVPAHRFAPGAVIGDFRVESELGAGSIGWVYRATQLETGVATALKILNPELFQDKKYLQRFLRDAEAAAQVEHPNLARFLEVGNEDGYYYFATEFVEGATLKHVLLHSGRLLPARALQMAEQVVSAFDAAWSTQKLVHGDIKPENIFLCENGSAKLVDLGMAHPAVPVWDPRFTETGHAAEYLSPEALLGKPLTLGSDLYSLGAVLYEAITGEPVFPVETPFEVAHETLLERLTPPRALKADIPASISRIVEILLAKRPEHRYQTAVELIRDLRRAKQGEMPLQPLARASQEPLPVPAQAQTKIKKPFHRKRVAPPKPGLAIPKSAIITGVAVLLAALVGGAVLFFGGKKSLPALPVPGSTVQTVPPLASVPPATQAGTGLRGFFFRDPEFRDLALSRVCPAIDFNWQVGSPEPGVLPNDYFSALFLGDIAAPVSGDYRFYAEADDNIQLLVNGKHVMIADSAKGGVSAFVLLTAKKRVPIRLEYVENTGKAALRLFWQGPGIPKQVVPAAVLYPAPESAVQSVAPPASPAPLS